MAAVATVVFEAASLLVHFPANVAVVVRVLSLYTSDAADDLLCVDLGGRRIIKKKKNKKKHKNNYKQSYLSQLLSY